MDAITVVELVFAACVTALFLAFFGDELRGGGGRGEGGAA